MNSIAKEINAFETWIYSIMLRILWTAHMTNTEILTMNSAHLLLNIVKQRQVACCGHTIPRDGLQRLLVEGKLNGKRWRERPRTSWMDNVKEWTHLSSVDCVKKADDRESWRPTIVHLLDRS